MRNVDKDKLGVALKGANEAVRDFFLGNMSIARRQDAADDMEAIGPVRLRDVDEAQALLVNLAKDLAAKGEIMLDQEPRRRRAGVLMAAPAKFLFDVDFAAPDKSRERPTQAEIAAAGSPRPRRAPIATASTPRSSEAAGRERPPRRAGAGARSGIAIKASPRALTASRRGMETEAVDVAVAVARKLCAELIAREPLAEIMALVADCFSHLVSTPHLVVRINDSLYEAARAQIERHGAPAASKAGSSILAEPDIATGDCRIEWADGGVVRERAATEAKISELVGRYLAAATRPA